MVLIYSGYSAFTENRTHGGSESPLKASATGAWLPENKLGSSTMQAPSATRWCSVISTDDTTDDMGNIQHRHNTYKIFAHQYPPARSKQEETNKKNRPRKKNTDKEGSLKEIVRMWNTDEKRISYHISFHLKPST